VILRLNIAVNVLDEDIIGIVKFELLNNNYEYKETFFIAGSEWVFVDECFCPTQKNDGG
jgi:hypothetical protein